MPATKHVWTTDEVRRLNADVHARGMAWPRYELIDGELLGDEMPPSPGYDHQDAVGFLFATLIAYVDRMRLGRVRTSPSDIEFPAARLLQPDLYVVAPAGIAAEPRAVGAAVHLAIEVVSPSSARDDRGRKRRAHQQARVPEYWVVDLDARIVERWRPSDEHPELLDRKIAWHPEGATEPLVIDLEALFTYARQARA